MNSFLKNTYFLILLLFSGMALPFYKDQEGMIFLLFASFLMMYTFKVGWTPILNKAIFVWLGFSLVVFVANRIFTPFFIFRHVVFIFTAYVVVSIYKERIFYKFENYIYYFALISMFFWIWMVLDLDSIVSFGRMVGINTSSAHDKKEYSNFIIYTINYVRDYPYIIPRNAGFCWEPGPFSNYMVIALFFNMCRNNFRFVWSFRVIVLIAALLTTQSTTGYVAFGALMIFYSILSLKGTKRTISLFFFIILFLYNFLTLDFMYDKVSSLYDSGKEIESEMYDVKGQEKQYTSAGRFGGLVIAWNDLKRSPLWGSGGASEKLYGNLGDTGVFIVSGLGRLISTYGLFGIVLYLLFLGRTSNMLSSIFNTKVGWTFLAIILVGSFSTSLHRQILPFTLIFFSLYYKHISRPKEQSG